MRFYVLPHIWPEHGIDTLTTGDVLAVLTPLWTDKPLTAPRVLQCVSAVCWWAMTEQYHGDDPTANELVGRILLSDFKIHRPGAFGHPPNHRFRASWLCCREQIASASQNPFLFDFTYDLTLVWQETLPAVGGPRTDALRLCLRRLKCC